MKSSRGDSLAGLRAFFDAHVSRFVPGLLLFYVLCILVLHTMPTGSASLGNGGVASVRPNHLVHLAMFLPWGILAVEYFREWPGGNLSRVLGCTLLGLILAVFAESIQYLLPYRSLKAADLLMNASGVGAGMVFALLWQASSTSLQRRTERNEA